MAAKINWHRYETKSRHCHSIVYILKATTNLELESMGFNGDDLENRQWLDKLFWPLLEDGASVNVPCGAFQVQTMRETAFQNNNSPD